MPLTKNEIIPPARRELGMLQELVDNRRQIRAREYERYRREISVYEDLRNVQKPLINVLKGLLEDRNRWDIKKMADGRVEWAKLSWSNLSPILQQLNRMDRNEATEVLTDISNKLPNALTAQRDLVTRLGALFAAKPSDQTVTTQDLDSAGLLTPLRREFRVGDQTEGFSPARPLYTGRKDREPIGAADAAPPPETVQPPRYAREGQEPIITPPHPDASAEEAGLPSSGTYDSMADLDQRYDPTTISLAGDLLSISQDQVDETLQRAADLAESDIPLSQLDLRDLQQSTVGRRIVDLVEMISESKGSRGTEVQDRAKKELHKFREAEQLSQTLRGTTLAEDVIRRGSTIRETPRRPVEETPSSWSDAIMRFGEREKVLPYRTNPLATLGQMAQQLRTGEQPFATGFAGAQQMGDTALDMVEAQERLKKKDPDSPTAFEYRKPIEAADAAPPPGPTELDDDVHDYLNIEGDTRPFRNIFPDIKDLYKQLDESIKNEDLGEAKIITNKIKKYMKIYEKVHKPQDSTSFVEDLPDDPEEESSNDQLISISNPQIIQNVSPSNLYVTGLTRKGISPTVITVDSTGSLASLFGQTLHTVDITPEHIIFEGTKYPITLNMWKALTVNTASAIKGIPLTEDDKAGLANLARVFGYKNWKKSAKGEEVAASNPRTAQQIQRALTARVVQSGSAANFNKKISELLEARPEPHQLEGEHQMNFPTGFDEMVGRGNKKWSPLKVAPNGDLGEVNISLPDLINNLELIVKRKEGGKVMLRRKECPIDLIRLLTRRFNPKIKYNEKARDLYKKVITLGKIPLGQTFSHKEHIFGTGIKVPTRGEQTPKSIINNSQPEDVMESLMSDLGTFRNGNRSSILKNNISSSADFLLKRDMIDKDEHKLIHTMIRRKGTKLTTEENELLTELFN